MQVQHIQIANPSDDYLLAATFYAPAETVRGCVVVESAMGVPRRFYDGFARWLSEQRLACVTFDFRGMFDSSALNPGYVRDMSLADWGRRDLESVIGWCKEAFGASPLFAISHSMGGHVIGLAPAAQRLERILLVGCGSIYWGLQPTPLSRVIHAAVWHALVPFTTAICGRFPGIANVLPVIEELTHATPYLAAKLYTGAAVANTAGRLSWGGVSDRIGHNRTYAALFGIQALAFVAMSNSHGLASLGLALTTILLCLGGGFGVMPSFNTRYFGTAHLGANYGVLLTAWGCAGIAGPLMAAKVADVAGSFAHALNSVAVVLVAAIVLPALSRKPHLPRLLLGEGGQ
jgi:hypothetical protein